MLFTKPDNRNKVMKVDRAALGLKQPPLPKANIKAWKKKKKKKTKTKNPQKN